MLVDPATGKLGLTRDELREWFGFYRRMIDSHALVPLHVRVGISGEPDYQTYGSSDFLDGKWAGWYNWDDNLSLVNSVVRKEFEYVLGEYLPSRTRPHPAAASILKVARCFCFFPNRRSKH